MKLGLKVNAASWDEAVRGARIAEDAGFDGLWTGDNMRNPRDPSIAVHDGLSIIAGWAAVTSRIRVGSLIANAVFRRPTVLAKQALTLDHISGGRFELGIGSGLWPTDHAMSGVSWWEPRERVDRLTEYVGVVDRLLSGDAGAHDGPYYPYSDASMTPGTIQERIPLIVAANGKKALAVTAERADGWVTFPGAATEPDFQEASIERVRTLDRLRAERGREPLRRILLAYGAITPWASVDAFGRMVDRYREIGFDEIVCYAPKAGEQAVFDKVVERLDTYR